MSEYTNYQSAKDANRKGFEQNYIPAVIWW